MPDHPAIQGPELTHVGFLMDARLWFNPAMNTTTNNVINLQSFILVSGSPVLYL
jgi:hypothetical protein